VNKHLEEGQADLASNTPGMAKAHARLVVIGPEIKFSVLFQNVAPNQHEKCLNVLKSAMDEWEKDLQGDLRFTRLPDDQTADVVVRFRPSVSMKGEPVAGYVNWKRALIDHSGGKVDARFSADLQIRVRNLDGNPMPQNAMRHAAMHELGHVLGLDDSPREGDVMGPLDIDNPVSAPTPLEIQTVKSIRSQAEQIILQAG
jgi:predicted Zn-dependent protease